MDHFFPALKLAFGTPVFAWWPLSGAVACVLLYSIVRQQPFRVLSASRLTLFVLTPFILCFIQVALGYAFAAPSYWARGSRVGTGLVALVFGLSILGGIVMIRSLRGVRLFASALVLAQWLFAASSALTALVLIHSLDLSA